MNNNGTVVKGLLALSCAALTSLSHAVTFEEKDGIVIIEAENTTLATGWTVKTDMAGHTGNGYLQYTGANSYGTPAPGSELTYKIKINSPGKYQFKWHTTNGPGAEKADQQNDSWVKLDNMIGEHNGKDGIKGTDDDETHVLDHEIKFYVQSLGAWKWGGAPEYHDENGARKVGGRLFANFDKAGTYTLKVSGRSKGHRIDRIALYKEGLKPWDLTLPETIAPEVPEHEFIGDTIAIQSVGNGKYVCADKGKSATQTPIMANRTAIGGWEKFDIVDAGDGYVGMKALANQLFVTHTDSRLYAVSTVVDNKSKFKFSKNSDGTYFIYSLSAQKYVSAAKNLDEINWPLVPFTTQVTGTWGKFNIEVK